MSIKEIWGKLKHWQRGGVVAAILGTVLFYALVRNIFHLHPEKLGAKLILISSFLYSPIFFSSLLIEEFLLLEVQPSIMYLLSIVIYFSIGASIVHVIYIRINSDSLVDESKRYTKIIAFLIITFYFLISVFFYILGVSY